MYTFKRYVLQWLTVHASLVTRGATHKKAFRVDTMPVTQSTLNIYVNGEFEVEVDGYQQRLTSGTSNRDLQAKFPRNAIVTETCVSETGCRLCLSVAGLWQVRKILCEAGGAIALEDGEVGVAIFDGNWQFVSESRKCAIRSIVYVLKETK